MRRGEKVLSLLLTVCLIMMISFAETAAAAEVPGDSYKVLISESLGEVSETLTRDLAGEVKTEELLINLVPENAVLNMEAKTEVGAIVLGYTMKDGILYSEALQWTILGEEQPYFYGFSPSLTGTFTFTNDYSYYELVIWDDDANDSYFSFKISNGEELLHQPDEWAKAEVDEAISAGLIPSELQDNYKENITRADFAKLIIRLVEVKTGLTIEDVLSENGLSLDDNPFTDTDLREVIAANKLGIVNGKGSGRFDPNGSLTRQEAAVMLTKTAIGLGYEVTAGLTTYSDNNKIAKWARESVAFVTQHGIMNGTGDHLFDPKGTYTRQQAYMTIVRLLR